MTNLLQRLLGKQGVEIAITEIPTKPGFSLDHPPVMAVTISGEIECSPEGARAIVEAIQKHCAEPVKVNEYLECD